MPTYLVHGFRWQRQEILRMIILNNLEDAAINWIIAPATSNTLLNCFYANFDFLPPSNPPQNKYDIPIPTETEPEKQERHGPRTLKKGQKSSMSSLKSFGGSIGRKSRPPNLKETNGGSSSTQRPHTAHTPSTSTSTHSLRTPSTITKFKKPTFNDWSVVKLLEQYDPNDLSVTTQPYAYVGDYMVDVTLCASLKEEMIKYEEKNKEADWPLSTPTSHPTPGSSDARSSSVASAGSSDLSSLGMSARDMRRKSRRSNWLEKLRDEVQKGEEIGWYVIYCGDEERTSPDTDSLQTPTNESRRDYSPQRTPRSAGLFGFFRGFRRSDEE